MTEAEKLCERLGSHMGKVDMQEVLRDCRSAAAMIAAQAEEIARLREALEPFRDIADIDDDTGRDDASDDRILVVQAYGCQLDELTKADFVRVRDALSPNGGG